MNDWNSQIIDEFRANGGKVGGAFQGVNLLLLHSTGAKSGQARVHPLAYQDAGNDVAVFASAAGAPKNPAWYHNVVANPDVTVEIGGHTLPMRARVAEGGERDRIWQRQKELAPAFADYEAKTSRTIPVIILQPVGWSG